MVKDPNEAISEALKLEASQMGTLIDIVSGLGYETYGPTVRNHAVIYDNVISADQLPVGWIDSQDGGTYRLRKSERPAFFDHVVGPHSWKRFLYPSAKTLWSASRENSGFKPDSHAGNGHRKLAFIGVRACDLQALSVQDRVLTQGEFVDYEYRTLRENLFIIAVNCTRPGGNCFCASLETGPKALRGYDLAITELFAGDRHYFVVDAGTVRGGEVASALATAPASDAELAAANEAMRTASVSMGRSLRVDGLYDTLKARFDDPHWQEIADRCLTCGNCTMVCPTCFCVNIEDSTDLTGSRAHRIRRWDSCFTLDFSYIHGGSIRLSDHSRYRQWMIHKLGYWLDQFDMLGCVGCGRCITWCPVGIDITEEAKLFMADID